MSAEPAPSLKTTYTFQGHEYDLKITMGHAIRVLQPKFGIDLNNILDDEVLDPLLQKMFLNDSLALDLWWYHVSQHLGDSETAYDSAIDVLTPENLQSFKDAWWNAVVLFIRPLRGDILKSILKEAPKLVKSSIERRLTETLSNSGS